MFLRFGTHTSYKLIRQEGKTMRPLPQTNRLAHLAAAVAVTLSLGWLAACVHVSWNWKGATAKQEDNVALMTAGPHEGIWRTHDLVVNYSYTEDNGNLNMEGTIDVAYHIQVGFTSLSNFSVYLNLLDESNLVVSSRLIAMAVGGSPIRTLRFEEQLDVPGTATEINFSYSGIATEGGSVHTAGSDDGGSSYSFWKNP
jgi:hypothetical protein